MNEDWRDGFLFVGNHLALDFVNTRPVIGGDPVEFLTDGAALARWLEASRLIGDGAGKPLAGVWSSRRLGAEVDSVVRFREHFRQALLGMEEGRVPGGAFLEEINRLLARYPRVTQVAKEGRHVKRWPRFAPQAPEDVFGVVADAVADVLTGPDWSKLRKCQSCVLHFLDTSKKGTRVWCSMRLCGNRAKVAAHARRRSQGLR